MIKDKDRQTKIDRERQVYKTDIERDRQTEID